MYCTQNDLTDYILEDYLLAVERKKPGLGEDTIKNVSGEIDDALRHRFVLPLSTIPATIIRICAVMSSFRMIGAITSLMESEASSGNEWLPLQTLYKQSVKDLESIRDGKLALGLKELGEEIQDSEKLVIVTTASKFKDWDRF